MATSADTLRLTPDSMAFVFHSQVGVNAADLGSFLQRASTVSRRAGADLYVVGLQEGSLAVIARVVRKGAHATIEEFKSSPVRTSASAVALVGAVTVALGMAMTPKPGQVSPLAKVGADLIQDGSVTQITIITVDRSIVVMDENRALEVRNLQVENTYEALPPPDLRRLIASARTDGISGTILDVSGHLHFRPDGFRYLVPIDVSSVINVDLIQPNQHIVVWGELLLLDSRPDLLVIRDANLQ